MEGEEQHNFSVYDYVVFVELFRDTTTPIAIAAATRATAQSV